MVERNRSGCSVSLPSFTAALLPSLISCSRRTSLTEMTAISAHAKMAFSPISTTCNTSCQISVVSKFYSS